jgi:hypothetical protein
MLHTNVIASTEIGNVATMYRSVQIEDSIAYILVALVNHLDRDQKTETNV